MNAHQHTIDRLPLYAAGQLDEKERSELDQHLKTCASCRADLQLWLAVRSEVGSANSHVHAPDGVSERALERIHTPSPLSLAVKRTFSLLFSQAYLVRREMWPSSAILMFMGIMATLLIQKIVLVRYFAPLVAAASLAAIFGPDHDPACELTLSTPTASWKVLLARLALVHGYNLILTLAASLILLFIAPPDMLWALILSWLGPMTFLPALALLLSLWTGSGNSVAVTYGLWLLQFINPKWIPGYLSNLLTPVVEAYRQFWGSPLLLVIAGLGLLVTALWLSGRIGSRLVQSSS
ncbi:MAG TPA: zf-HC2 domain-containing protein [Anaerolineaceae bacterium]|nr:zf-HC2 domain-containing protein [Anaerolineaceae bacterium]